MLNALHFFYQGFLLIRHKSVRGFILWPLAVNALLFVGVSIYAYSAITDWMQTWQTTLPDSLLFLTSLLKMIIVVLLMLASMFSFGIVTTFITAPFYCLVAEKVALALDHPTPNTPVTFNALSALCWRSLSRELQKLMYYLPRTLLLLIFSFIPVINTISPLLWAIWGAWLLSLQFVDYAADNDMVSATACRERLANNQLDTLCLGGLIMLGMMIPIINIIIGVVAVSAATVYWITLSQTANAK